MEQYNLSKLYFFINSTPCCDGFHKNVNNTYLVVEGDGKSDPKAGPIYTSIPLSPAMKEELPENYVRYTFHMGKNCFPTGTFNTRSCQPRQRDQYPQSARHIGFNNYLFLIDISYLNLFAGMERLMEHAV